jgi:hypothetical protein
MANPLWFGDYFLNILHPPAAPIWSDGCQASNKAVDRPRICSKSNSTDLIASNKILLKTRLISSWHVPSRHGPSSITKPLILKKIDYDFAHCPRVKCSEYLSRTTNPSLTFSNPFKIPERTKLKRSSGSKNLIKCKRTSTFSDEKFMVRTLSSRLLRLVSSCLWWS